MDRKHFAGLDALRGIAASLVLALHVGQMFPTYAAVSHGYLGVDLFFMLSGFVLARSYEKDLLSGALSWRRYAVRRLARIYPMILIGLALGVAVAAGASPPPDHLAARMLLQALTLPSIFWWGHTFVLNPTQWSLFFEFWVNAVHARCLRALTLPVLGSIVAISACLLVVAVLRESSLNLGWDRHTLIWGFPRTSFSFFLGVTLFRMRERLPKWGRGAWLCLPALVGCVIGAGLWGGGWVDLLVVVVAFPAIMVAGISADTGGIADQICRRAGAVSFPLYATQGPLLEVAHRVLGSGPQDAVAWTMVAMGLVVAADLLNSHIDQPIQARLQRRLKLRPARAATVP